MQLTADDNEECGAVFKEERPTGSKTYTTKEEQVKLIKEIHESKLGRYMGIIKTVARIKAGGYDFPGLRKRVEEVLAVCDIY